MADHPKWHRSRLSREICIHWNWVNANGQLKDMACRTMLLKLERLGYLRLPAARSVCVGNSNKSHTPVDHSTASIACSLHDLTPLCIEIVRDTVTSKLFKHLLSEYHYLGFSGKIGENMQYIVYDRQHRPLACLLFGSAAWKVVSVPHLASHLLAKIAKRISDDWIHKYGHPVFMLETFVEQGRFQGVCYRAANWLRAGQTQGRSRNDRNRTLQVPIKDVYLYPLIRNVREVLNQ